MFSLTLVTSIVLFGLGEINHAEHLKTSLISAYDLILWLITTWIHSFDNQEFYAVRFIKWA